MVAQVKLIDLAHYPVSGDLFLENEKCSGWIHSISIAKSPAVARRSLPGPERFAGWPHQPTTSDEWALRCPGREGVQMTLVEVPKEVLKTCRIRA